MFLGNELKLYFVPSCTTDPDIVWQTDQTNRTYSVDLFMVINSLRLIIIKNRGCLTFWSLYTLTVITVNIANPALGVASLYKDLYADETNETFILYQSYIAMTVVLVPLVSIIQHEKYIMM